MLTFDQRALANLVDDRRATLLRRLNDWLRQEFAHWDALGDEVCARELSAFVHRAEKLGLHSEHDFALFVRLMVELGPLRESFLAQPRVGEILAWDVPNPAAKIEALYFWGAPGVTKRKALMDGPRA